VVARASSKTGAACSITLREYCHSVVRQHCCLEGAVELRKGKLSLPTTGRPLAVAGIFAMTVSLTAGSQKHAACASTMHAYLHFAYTNSLSQTRRCWHMLCGVLQDSWGQTLNCGEGQVGRAARSVSLCGGDKVGLVLRLVIICQSSSCQVGRSLSCRWGSRLLQRSLAVGSCPGRHRHSCC
jgi:hypothetical protein